VPSIPDFGLKSLPIDDALEDADLALIVTAHAEVDHEALVGRVPILVDLRGVTRAGSDRVVRL
jgi:UDP-N-acetyl-D-mannosaminuronate dehydrogenase